MTNFDDSYVRFAGQIIASVNAIYLIVFTTHHLMHDIIFTIDDFKFMVSAGVCLCLGLMMTVWDKMMTLYHTFLSKIRK